MLELLSSKGHDGLNQFLDHMSLYYTWIAEPIKSSLIREHNTFLTRMKQVLTAGEVPQLSLRHVSRTEHVRIFILYNYFYLYYMFLNLFTGKPVKELFKGIRIRSFCRRSWHDRLR